MRIRTIEDDFEYQVKKIIKEFKRGTESNATGEELADELWNDKAYLGELFFNKIFEVLGDEFLED